MNTILLSALDRLHTAIANYSTATGTCPICGGTPNECFPDCAVGNARSTLEHLDQNEPSQDLDGTWSFPTTATICGVEVPGVQEGFLTRADAVRAMEGGGE
jgi:hypothetical protein